MTDTKPSPLWPLVALTLGLATITGLSLYFVPPDRLDHGLDKFASAVSWMVSNPAGVIGAITSALTIVAAVLTLLHIEPPAWLKAATTAVAARTSKPPPPTLLVLAMLGSLTVGCGATQLQQQAVYSTVAMRVTAAADDVVEAQEASELAACHDVVCVDALHDRYAPIVATLDSLRLALLAWGAAIATAAEADAGADVPTVVLDAMRAALGLWPGVVSIAATLGVTLPPLPPLLLALLVAAS